MADRSRIRAGNGDRVSTSSQEDHHPTKKSRDSSHQWSQDVSFTGGIKSLMDIDFDSGTSGDRISVQQQDQFGRRAEGQNGQRQYQPIASLLDVHLMRRPPGNLHQQQQQQQPPPLAQPVLPYMMALAGASSHPGFPTLYHPPFRNPVAPLMPIPQSPLHQPLLRVPPPPAPQQSPVALHQDDGHIPSLLDLPMGGERRPDQPQALLPGLAVREAEFEQLMERLCTSVRTRLPLCCVKPVKALETALQRCQLPRGVRKYKQIEKGQPILCKLYVNNLLIGSGVGDTTWEADIQAYSRALRLLRETAFEDILFGMPLREEITEILANLPQRQSPSPKPQNRFVVLEDRKPEQGSNSYYILMLSAQFSGRTISMSTEREESGQCSTKVLLDETELASASGEDEMEVRRIASNQALVKLKATAPVIEITSNTQSWRNQIRKNLRTKLEERVEFMDKHITQSRPYDEPIIISTSQFSLKAPIASVTANDLEEIFSQIIDIYVQSDAVSPLIIAPLPARSQRLLFFRLARQRALCSESIRLSTTSSHDLSLVPIICRRLEASMLLPVLQSAEGNCTEQFLLVKKSDEAAEELKDKIVGEERLKAKSPIS